VLGIPDAELWAVRQSLRHYLFAFIRERMRQRWTIEHVSTPRVVAGGTLLAPETLTIGFARRFTGYKRSELIFHDAERLARILNAVERPVQLILPASRAADDIGKPNMQRVWRTDPLSAGASPRRRLRSACRPLSRQGCDVWLNLAQADETSGTSGMAAERRAASEHRRRLVGRRLRRDQWLDD
jgi:starch phosphorylase